MVHAAEATKQGTRPQTRGAAARSGPAELLSTLEARNYVAHPRKYNEWIRNNLEQLKREGATYTAHDIVGSNPRLTSGGYIIPEAELFLQYGLNAMERR